MNARQRVILVAEHFDFEVLATAEWLAEGYGVEIKCVKIALRGDGETRYLTAETIFPASPLFDHAWRRRAVSSGTPAQGLANSWDEVCGRIVKPEIRSLAENLGSSLPNKDLSPKYWAAYLRVGNRRTVNVEFRYDFAYVWQERRFKGDQDFWTERLGQEISLQDVKSGQALRFYLRTSAQCEAFLIATQQLGQQDFTKASNLNPGAELAD